MRPVLVEISEFLANPIRSGVQRVVRELVMNWPTGIPVRFARFDATQNALVRVSDRALGRAIAYEPEHGSLRQDTGCDREGGSSAPLRIEPDDVILVPEVFYDHGRVRFYQNLLARGAASARFIVYDFVPWLMPSAIGLGARSSPTIMPYLMLLTEATHRCFISDAVKSDFAGRIARRIAGPADTVISLGSDGLSIEKQNFTATRTDLVCLGTLDGKKRQDIIFDAFRTLDSGRRGRLVCLGKVHARPAPFLRGLLNNDLDDVIVIDSPSESEIAERLRTAKATAFVSPAEGFGLPVVESLHCGIPVVAYAGLPCLSRLPSAGQIRITDVTVDAVAAALARLSVEAELRRLWSEAASLALPSWADYARSVATWATAAPTEFPSSGPTRPVGVGGPGI